MKVVLLQEIKDEDEEAHFWRKLHLVRAQLASGSPRAQSVFAFF